MGEHRGERSDSPAVKSGNRVNQKVRKTAYVINLCSSMRPITVAETLDLSGLGDCRLFQNHSREDGRERYRLQLGLFASDVEATKAVYHVRRDFPAALVMRATQDDLRNFDGYVETPGEQAAVETVELRENQYEHIVLGEEPARETPRIRRVNFREKRVVEPAREEWVDADIDSAGKDPTTLAVERATAEARRQAPKPKKAVRKQAARSHAAQKTPPAKRRPTKPVRPKSVTGGLPDGAPANAKKRAAKPKPKIRRAVRKKPQKAKRLDHIVPDPEVVNQLSLSDTAKVKHLKVESKEPSLASRLLSRFTKKGQ